jgi:Undecaprenyl-phosphate glucose phosphotransferase
MIRGHLKRVQLLLTVSVFSLPLVSFAIAGYFRFATHLIPHFSSDVDPSIYFGLLLLTTILWAVAAEHYELTSIEYHLLPRGKNHRILLACMTTFTAVLAITFFYRDSTFSRVFIWISAVNLLLSTLLLQKVFRWHWKKARLGGKAAVHLLIVGADQFAVRVADSLLTGGVAPCGIKGHIRLPGQSCAVVNHPVYELADVDELAIGNGFDDVIIAIPPRSLSELPRLRMQLAALCVPLKLVLDVGEGVPMRQMIFHLGDLLMLDLQSTRAETAIYVILKRAFDLIFSLFILIAVAPLLAAIAVAVRLTSPGPAIFAQDRVGLNGKLFRMYKFRTMTFSSSDDSDARWTIRDDPRCTRLGRILRHMGMDELPQFFNVLKGDMSVVGPRPERPVLVQKFMQSVGNYNTRHFLKVGITGWAQVNGWRGDTSIEKRVEYDLYYVRNWTLAFDLLIVVLTLFRGFTDKNAY